MAGIPEFLLTSVLIELTPGPNMAYLAALAMARGRKPALFAVAGVACGLLLLGLLAALGLQAIILASPWLYQAIRYAGFAYLLWLAWETWQPPTRTSQHDESFDGFRKGFITNLLNPKAGVFYLTVVPAFIAPANGSIVSQNVLLAVIYVTVATVIHTAIVLFADAAGRILAADGRIGLVRKTLALGLVAVALWFFWKT
ncbi:MAG: LysE family translocator [Beijerinckiaceae bacterium]